MSCSSSSPASEAQNGTARSAAKSADGVEFICLDDGLMYKKQSVKYYYKQKETATTDSDPPYTLKKDKINSDIVVATKDHQMLRVRADAKWTGGDLALDGFSPHNGQTPLAHKYTSERFSSESNYMSLLEPESSL